MGHMNIRLSHENFGLRQLFRALAPFACLLIYHDRTGVMMKMLVPGRALAVVSSFLHILYGARVLGSQLATVFALQAPHFSVVACLREEERAMSRRAPGGQAKLATHAVMIGMMFRNTRTRLPRPTVTFYLADGHLDTGAA